MVSKVSNRIFDVVVSYLSSSSFSTSLTPPLSMDRQSLAEVGNELSIDYTVPSALCRPDANGKSYFTVSAILALLDDFSSYALMLQDRNHRPGVSVTLDTEIIKNCQAGEKIRLVSRCDKIGKSVAFCSMEILSSKGDVLARGKHIKYVKMGFGWDLLTSFLLFPIVLMIVEYLIASKNKKDKAKQKDAPQSTAGSSQLGKVFTDLNMSHVADPAALFAAAEQPADGEHKKRKKRKQLPVFATDEHCYALKVTRTTSNVLGHMHGGAVAAAAEEASMQLACRNGSQSAAGRIDGIQVSYISPMKGELIVAVKEDPLAAHRKRRITEGRVISKKSGQVCAEFKCNWAL